MKVSHCNRQRLLALGLTETRLARIERIAGLTERAAAGGVDVTFDEANERRAEEIARADRERHAAAGSSGLP